MQRKSKRAGWGGPRPGSGRKPLPSGQRRSRRIMVNLTEEEAREVEEAAGDASVSDYIRRLVLRHLARRRT